MTFLLLAVWQIYFSLYFQFDFLSFQISGVQYNDQGVQKRFKNADKSDS